MLLPLLVLVLVQVKEENIARAREARVGVAEAGWFGEDSLMTDFEFWSICI